MHTKNLLNLILIYIALTNVFLLDAVNKEIYNPGFGLKSLLNFVLDLIPKNKTIIIFGSNELSHQLSEYYKIYSLETNEITIKDKISYIYLPSGTDPADYENFKSSLPVDYDLIIINDLQGFSFFLKNVDMFKNDISIIANYINDPRNHSFMMMTARHFNILPTYYWHASQNFGILYK